LSEGTPKGSNTASSLAAAAGNSDGVAVKPLVKHILSKELQLYYERVCSAIMDEGNETLRSAALSSLRHDPGLHQLLPYFLNFVSEKVTHRLRDMFVLHQMMDLTHALLENQTLFIEPYVSSIVPPILTCLIGKRLGDPTTFDHYALRDYAASLIRLVCRRFGESSHTLRPRLTRACLKQFLDPSKPLGTHYGSIIGLAAIGGRESVRVLILPNLKLYEKVIRPELEEDTPKKRDAEMVVEAIFSVLKKLEDEESPKVNRVKSEDGMEGMQGDEGLREALARKIGDVAAERVCRSGQKSLAKAILETRIGGPKVSEE
jgi:transcription initiation factor TFIID subunit 6